MALPQPEFGGTSRAEGVGGGLLPRLTAPLRGALATTACMETLQVGYLHAVAAAAGCSLSQPFPDNGIDWHVSHSSAGHTVDDEVTIKVQLKCTYQIPPHPPGPAFSFTLDNDHLVKLARTPVSVHKILVVMLVPRTQDDWLRAESRPARSAALLLLDQPGRPPGDGQAQDHCADPDLTDLRRPCALRDHDAGRGGRETLMRPFDESVRPHPTAEAPGTWYGGEPDPAQVDPVVLGALLDRHGWRRRGGAAGRYARWTPPGHAVGGTSLLVPESRSFPDSEDLLGEALVALSRSAAPSAREVLVGLTVPSDEVRWWRDVPQGPSGAASWTAQEQLRAAARQMLMAGALAARGRAGYYGARHRRQAQASLEGVLVGPAPGGRSLTAFVPVAGGRSVVVRLHHALQATREATDYQRATGGMEAFDEAVELGVSRELTEAVIALVRGSEGARITLDWSPGRRSPRRLCAPHRTGGVLARRPARAARGKRALSARRAVRAGTDHRHGGPDAPLRAARSRDRDGCGCWRGSRCRTSRVALEEEAYRTAGHAHLVGLPIRVVGRLESRGGFRRLTDATDVTPVQVDDAERDRLMKSLQENLDFFEDACGAGD